MILANTHPFLVGKSVAPALRPGAWFAPWRQIGALAVLCSGVAMAALPRTGVAATSEEHQWQALGIAPLSAGGRTGLRLVATEAVEPIEFAPDRPTLQMAIALEQRRFNRRAIDPRRRHLRRCRQCLGTDRLGSPGHSSRNPRIRRARCADRIGAVDRAGGAACRPRNEPGGRAWRGRANLGQTADCRRHQPSSSARPCGGGPLLVIALRRRLAAIGSRISPGTGARNRRWQRDWGRRPFRPGDRQPPCRDRRAPDGSVALCGHRPLGRQRPATCQMDLERAQQLGRCRQLRAPFRGGDDVAGRGADHVRLRLSLSPDPAFRAHAPRHRLRRALGHTRSLPPPMGKSPRRAGLAATGGRSGLPTAAASPQAIRT